MQEKITFEMDKENYDIIKLLQEALPAEEGEKLSENEVLKMVLGTFMAFVQGDDEQEHTGCGCGQGHCH